MTRSTVALVAGVLAMVLVVLVVIQVAALRADVASARRDAAAAASGAAEMRTAVSDVRNALDDLGAELAALPHSGVVPTDSSSLILKRITALGDQVASLSDRLDQICQNAPMDLC